MSKTSVTYELQTIFDEAINHPFFYWNEKSVVKTA